MMNVCLYPSLLGAHLATKYLAENGLMIFTGAAAVFKEPQPDMIAYSMAKTAVHSLALNLTEKAKMENRRVITLLPETVDTESNRAGMPDADFSKWAKPEQIG
jgi:NAD(P)-dependent dehydrogenase (short-subunit alcohol dehydrogenase family)